MCVRNRGKDRATVVLFAFSDTVLKCLGDVYG